MSIHTVISMLRDCGRILVSLPRSGALCLLVSALLGLASLVASGAESQWALVGWNNLGMHCMDSDYSVFSVLPPYNTINAQLIRTVGTTTNLITDPGAMNITMTYEAIADPAGSINATSESKTNFWEYVEALFGVALPVNVGLPVPGPNSYAMPTGGIPLSMGYESAGNWFVAYGIPITPYDDNANGKANQYPMMRLVARDGSGAIMATTDIVLPVSDEMDCKLCHLSGSGPAARPSAGWVNDPNPGRDYRLNILRLHDEKQDFNPDYPQALAANGFHSAGLYATVTINGRPILCASCHLSEALPGSGLAGIKALTAAVHGFHASVVDPRGGMTLDVEGNRIACYTCHPGSVTRCLRGAMGKAVAADGTMAMQCQSCHGSMSAVGDLNRTGWLQEPNCQACHTGDAVNNSGQIRYTSVFDSPGHIRVPTNTRFATTPDAPAPGVSLYRFSIGHNGLQCSACHGSTHAEFPSAFVNDNVANVQHQGHAGVLVECGACHGAQPDTVFGGPHGLHFLGQTWVQSLPGQPEANPHADAFGDGPNNPQCQACHGLDYAGTALSRAQNDRTINAHDFGVRSFWRGQRIGCYDCHNGANDNENPGPMAPSAQDVALSTDAGVTKTFTLPTSSAVSWRIVSQPSHGTVGVAGDQATYYPATGFAGNDTFTYAAFNDFRESNLATGTVTVTAKYSLGDDIPDWWRQLHFGCIDCADAAAAADPDHDLLGNLGEFGAGTDPLDSRSRPRIFALGLTGSGANLGFVTLLDRKYEVQWSDNLLADGWNSLIGVVWGHTDTVTINDPVGNGQVRRFYRVRVIP